MIHPEEYFSPFDLANGAAGKLSPSPDFDGPVKRRRITDPLCLLLLLGLWGVATWIGVWSLQNGDYNIFLRPTDYKGRVCGVDTDDNGVVLPSFIHIADTLSNGVCVNECPTEMNLAPTSRSDLICKDESDLLSMNTCLSGSNISNDPDTLISCSGCMYAMGVNQIKNQCLPGSVSPVIASIDDVLESKGLGPIDGFNRIKQQSYIIKLMDDLHTSILVVAGAIGGTTICSLMILILYLVPRCIAFVIWFTALLVPGVFGVGGFFLWLLADRYANDETSLYPRYHVLFITFSAIFFWSLGGISLISLIDLRKKINLTIDLTKAGSRAIREVKLSFLFPIVQVVFYGTFLATIGYWLINFSTTGVFVEQTETVFGSDIIYTVKKFTTFEHYKFWFMILVLIWTSSFFITLGRMIISLCAAQWYYTPQKDEGNSVSVIQCTFTALLKHAGTASFASLVMGPLVFIRTPFLILQRSIQYTGMNNICIDTIICCCQCSFFILERFLKFSSKNAYVQTALFGYSFCKSSHESYYLLTRNKNNIIDAGPVGLLCTLYTRICLCGLSCIVSYLVLDLTSYRNDLYSVEVVIAVIGMISWFTAGFFMEMIGMSVTTVFQCYLADEEMLGNEESLYIPNEMDEFLLRLDECREEAASSRRNQKNNNMMLSMKQVVGDEDNTDYGFDDDYTVDSYDGPMKQFHQVWQKWNT